MAVSDKWWSLKRELQGSFQGVGELVLIRIVRRLMGLSRPQRAPVKGSQGSFKRSLGVPVGWYKAG